DRFLKVTPRPPLANAGGAVIHRVGTIEGGGKCGWIAEVAGDDLDAERVEEGGVARGPHHGPDLFARADQLLGDVTAQQAGGRGDDAPSHDPTPFARGTPRCARDMIATVAMTAPVPSRTRGVPVKTARRARGGRTPRTHAVRTNRAAPAG